MLFFFYLFIWFMKIFNFFFCNLRNGVYVIISSFVRFKILLLLLDIIFVVMFIWNFVNWCLDYVIFCLLVDFGLYFVRIWIFFLNFFCVKLRYLISDELICRNLWFLNLKFLILKWEDNVVFLLILFIKRGFIFLCFNFVGYEYLLLFLVEGVVVRRICLLGYGINVVLKLFCSLINILIVILLMLWMKLKLV